jgi:hypothetical protein
MKISRPILFGQTLLDIASQELGDASRAFEIAVMNNKGITDDLTVGEALLTPDADISKRGLLLLFSDASKSPASYDIAGEMKSKLEGVEFWKLENDFIIQ